jgi:hypothetical protein
MSVSSHGDDVTIVNVHFSYMKTVISLSFWWVDLFYIPRMEAGSLLPMQEHQSHSDFAHMIDAQRRGIIVPRRTSFRNPHWTTPYSRTFQIVRIRQGRSKRGCVGCPACERGRKRDMISDNSSHVNRVIRSPYQPGYSQGLILYTASKRRSCCRHTSKSSHPKSRRR